MHRRLRRQLPGLLFFFGIAALPAALLAAPGLAAAQGAASQGGAQGATACLPPAPAPASPPMSIEQRYMEARRFYEARQHREAAVRFREIAFSAPDHELARFSANLYLDSLNLLLREAPACGAELEAAVPRLSALLCAPPARRRANEELCEMLPVLACQLDRRAAEALSAAGRHADARDGYLRLLAPGRACPRPDEALYNASIEARAAGDEAGATQLRARLRRELPDSPLNSMP